MAENLQKPGNTTEQHGRSGGRWSSTYRRLPADNHAYSPGRIRASVITALLLGLSMTYGVFPTVSSVLAQEATQPGVQLPTGGDNRGVTIERKGEGRHFFTTISIPPGAETLYLSGTGASPQADGSWGTMEEQTINTFNKFKASLEAEGWSMSDIVQVRAFAVAGEYGLLDFDGFNRGYRQFFGTEENPQKPVRSFVQVADLVVEGWLVEIEIRAARMP